VLVVDGNPGFSWIGVARFPLKLGVNYENLNFGVNLGFSGGAREFNWGIS
jgi:hypothetical protein